MEAWVTSVVEDKDVVKALVLASSLKRAATGKSLVLLASPLLSEKNRRLLGKQFHQVIIIDQHHSVNGWIGMKDYAKLYSFNLTLFRKCVYLAPETVVVKNCDEMFEACEGKMFSAFFKDDKTKMDLSVLCFQPSTSVFEHLLCQGKRCVKEKGFSFDAYLKEWLVNQKGFGKLEEKYNFAFSLDSISFGDFSIANLSNDLFELLLTPGQKKITHDGILESAVLRFWRSIYVKNVQPIMPTEEDAFQIISNPQSSEESLEGLHDAIAIVGISCRHAGTNNFKEFWEMLINGHSGIRPVPADRWTKEHGCKAGPAYESTPAGFLSQPIDEFDAKLFGISPKELEFLDPQQRLLLEVSWEALENAAIDPQSLYGSHTGVYVGAWMNDYRDLLTNQDCSEFYRIYMGNSFGAAAARLSYFLGLTGNSVATESGCSSAMVAVDLACKNLRQFKSNLALACGVNLLLQPFNKDTMSFIIAEDGICKTFDEKADGFGRSEACGVLVLKRYADAIKDGDDIWALIRGSSCVQEGLSRSMGTPTVECESLAMKLALKDACVHPKDVSFVEAHGTGTALGDPLEVSAINEVYGGHSREEPLIIGSVKTNIGHTESCSGITGMIKVIASLQHEIIPPHLNLTKLNPKINLEAIPAQIPMEALPWPRKEGKPRFAAVSSFGITGTDGHLILQEAPQRLFHSMEVDTQERLLHILKLSAKTEEALDAMLNQYRIFLDEEKYSNSFPDICYTANTGRATFSHRAVLLAASCAEASKLIQTKKYSKVEVVDCSKRKICFLFTGQGSQYTGMSKQLYDTSPVFRIHFEKCHKILLKKYEINIKETLWSASSSWKLSQTLYSQPAIFCVEYAMLMLWESWGVKPDIVLGHSLGEFCAAVAAKVLSLEDALMLVAERSRLVEENLPEGKMLVVRANKAEADQLIKEYVAVNKEEAQLDIAAVNSNEQTVLAGKPDTVERFAKFCSEQKNIKSLILDSSHAFHSREMDPILKEYKKVVSQLQGIRGDCNESECKYISGVYGKLVQNSEKTLMSPKYWIDHCREKVNFVGACKALASEGCNLFIEVGPQPILSALVCANNPNIKCLPSFRKQEENWKTVLTSLSKLYLSGYEINWKDFDLHCNRKKLHSLPTYPFQRKKYWFDAQNISGQGNLLNSPVLHPLLGSAFPNASGQKIYQSGLDLKKNAEWMKDHCIGKRIIFPGAGFLEMCLGAGHASTEGLIETFCKPSGPITIENLKVTAPLAIDEKQICQLQVILDNSTEKENQHGMKVQVFRKLWIEGEAPKWVQHCSSLFTPAVVGFDELQFRTNFDFCKIKNECTEGVETPNIYKTLAEVGLNFGPAFQSLTNIWKGTKGILAEVKVPHDWMQYIVHPVLLDAMLQSAMIVQTKGELKTLHVPIGIKKFTWLQHNQFIKNESPAFFVYSCMDSENAEECLSVLFDGTNGSVIAFMNGMEFAETSIQSIESHLESQESNLLPLYHEVWKPTLGPYQNRIDKWATLFSEEILNQETVHKVFKNTNSVAEDYWKRENALENLCYGYLIKAFYELGWNPSVGDHFTLDEFISKLEISQQHRKLVRYHMTVLEREGILKITSNNDFEVSKLPPAVSRVNVIINESNKILEQFRNLPAIIHIYNSCGKNVAPILRGKESALTFLFPQDSESPSADSLYAEIYDYNEVDLKTVNNMKQLLVPDSKGIPGVLRILEVGAGTGNFTGAVLKTLVKYQEIQVEYTFTDISPAFFNKAAKKFEEHKDSMNYKVLNLETDAKLQGFSPGYFDFIIGGDVVHATKDLSESLSNLRQLLTPKGLLCLIEGERRNHITCIFGFLDGYWRFTDTDIRQDHPLVSGETWKNLCLNLGFDKAVVVPCSNNFCNFMFARASNAELKMSRPIAYSAGGRWLVFPTVDPESKHIIQRLSLYRRVITVWKSLTFQQSSDGLGFGININQKEHLKRLFAAVKGESKTEFIEGIVYLWGISASANTDQAEIAQPFLNLCQTVVELKQQQLPKFALITKGALPIGNEFCKTPAVNTLLGMAKSCANEMNMRIKMIDLDPEGTFHKNSDESFFELWNDSNEMHMAYRDGSRHFGKIVKTKLTEKALKLPQCERFQLILPQSKAITDLKFGPLGNHSLKPNEIEVKVKAAALNFRDVFAVMKPDPQFDKINVVGSDFAGVVSQVGSEIKKWSVGDAVFGCNLEDGALPSHVKIVEDAVIKIPKTFTFPEAATLPAVFATAYYSLVTVAKMKPGDTVLIHTASGGVGLSAIQLCQHIGARVIATAGSARKRAYLKSIGIRDVFHSRNTNYEKDIMNVTNGRGVDIVLNSLTGPGFKEASLNVCTKNARFVEMSKLSIWQPEEVKASRSDVDYTIVDLTSVSQDVWADLFKNLDGFLQKGIGRPIPYVRFDGVHIREALTYLQKAKHIGKIVCVMPQTKFQSGQYVHETPLFNQESTYLITGGLGGIGLEVCKWMAAQGAKNIVLVSRSQPKDKPLEVIKCLRNQNINVITKSVDVGDFAMCKALIDFIQDPKNNLPPLKGIMHAAGVLSDATLINQSWEKYLQTFRPKVKGAWNLHILTDKCQLEHFVMFSSMASLFGPPGQSNHAASNSYLDGLAWHRETLGLHATTINWGQWGQVGVAAGKEVRGVMAFSPQRGIAALEAIMKSQQTQICVVDMDVSILMKIHSQYKPYFQYLLKGSSSDSQSVSVKSEKFWEEFDLAKDDEKPKVIKHYLKILLRQILKLDDDEPIDDGANFQDIGLDSLMMIELKNSLQSVLGSRITIPASAMQDCNNIELLADKLLQQMNDNEQSANQEKHLNEEEMINLIKEDCTLSLKLQEALDGLGNKPGRPLSLAKVFLLTGVTGKLAPYLLKELLDKHKNAVKIYCLLRHSSNALQRLRQSVQDAGIDADDDVRKIHLITGDLSLPNFGFDKEKWDQLTDEVDAVIHCAVKSNHVERYGLTSMRNVNVFGTKHILEFCCEGKMKHLFHSSSIVAVASTNDNGHLSEDWPAEDELKGVSDLGYLITKMICDRLIHQAVLKGLPAKSFRFSGLTGHSETGKFKHVNNHVILRFLCYMKLGAMPSVPVPAFYTPVDLAAKFAMRIFLEEDLSTAPYDIYNLCHPNPALEQEFPLLAKEFGYEVEVVDHNEFVNRFASEGEDSPLYPFRELYENEEKYNSTFSFPDVVRKWLEDPDNFFSFKKVAKVVPEYSKELKSIWKYLRNDLHYARDAGLFEKLRLSKH